MKYGTVKIQFTMSPGTGKAVPVLKGEILRVEQVEDGGQGLDFNAYNLHDYKESLHAGRTRIIHGYFDLAPGDMLWSRSPRDRPMFIILEDTCGRNDTTLCRCTAMFYEMWYGFDYHTNCQDIFAEAIREYGLTPDETHDSVNFFGAVRIAEDGKHIVFERNPSKKGDYVDLLATMDTLAVPIVCGNDVQGPINNFRLKPLRVTIYGKSDESPERVSECEKRYMSFKNQKTPKDFILKEVKSKNGELTRDPEYSPQFSEALVKRVEVKLEMSKQQYDLISRMAAEGDLGKTVNEVILAGFFNHLSSRAGTHAFIPE